MRHEWTDRTGDIGSMFTDGNNICLRLSEDPNEDEDGDVDPVIVLHCLPPAQARALHEALGRALDKVDPRPVTGSISATLAACSAPVPEIIRVHPTGTGDHGSIDVTTDDGLTRYAVQQVLGRSLCDVTVDELAKLGLKPSQMEPRPTGNGASALRPRPFWWDSSAAYGSVGNGGDFQMDLKYLLECAPTALDAHESFQPCDPRDYPTFGIGPEFTGPRTLREYLEAP